MDRNSAIKRIETDVAEYDIETNVVVAIFKQIKCWLCGKTDARWYWQRRLPDGQWVEVCPICDRAIRQLEKMVDE